MACYTTNSFEGKIIKLKLKWGTCCLAFFDLLVNWGVGMKASIIIYIYNDTGRKIPMFFIKINGNNK